jgi:predicted nucleic acid-binding protein
MICLDTTAIIDFLNGRKEAIELVEKNENVLVTTEINVFETFIGIYNKKKISETEENKARDLFNAIDILPMKKGSGKLAAKIVTDLSKKGIVIGQNDCMTAAIMLMNGCDSIMTKNAKHFSKINDIKVVPY